VRFVPTVLYAVAMRRDRLPSEHLALGPARVVWLHDAPVTEAVKSTCTVQSPPPFAAGADSILEIPESGVTSLEHLSDGTPIFVVRHMDGALDVFAADAPSWFDIMQHRDYPLRGLRDEVRWDCTMRGFGAPGVGAYDEYGVPVSALEWRSLDRYRTVATAEGSVLVPRDGRVRGYGPRRLSSPPEAMGGPVIEPYAGMPELTIAGALERPLGSRVVVKGDLVLEPRSPVLCDGLREVHDAWPDCAGARAVAEGVGWSQSSRWSIHGPFAARVTRGGLSDVTLLNAFYFVPEWEDTDHPHDWRTFKVEGTLAAFGAAGSGAGAIGAEASASARATPWPSESVLRALVSEDVGVALRARWFASMRSGRSDYRFGVAALFEDSSLYRDWSYPSPLGVLWPEAGVGLADAEVFPYLAWSLPVEYHLESPRLRRHPFGPREVLGVRIAPTVMLSFVRSTTEVLYGTSLGASFW
jgi:hypothetical protein